MTLYILLALFGGVLVVVSRQVNGRLSMSTSAMEASFWNHFVGFVFVSLLALIFGGLFAGDPAGAPWWAYFGGWLGVIFIAASSWAVTRIGAAQTAMLIIAGQMISGVALDLMIGVAGNPIARVAGVLLILCGMWIARSGKRQPT